MPSIMNRSECEVPFISLFNIARELSIEIVRPPRIRNIPIRKFNSYPSSGTYSGHCAISVSRKFEHPVLTSKSLISPNRTNEILLVCQVRAAYLPYLSDIIWNVKLTFYMCLVHVELNTSSLAALRETFT